MHLNLTESCAEAGIYATSEAEREYWREHLPRMSPEQCEKLTRILSQAKDIAWQRNPQTFLTLLKRTNAVLEKHLSPTRQ